jgi:hypothetical protein
MPKYFYMPRDWFWLADDGRLYGSAKQLITTVADPDYIAWQGEEPLAEAQIWPRDNTGAQTNASMQEVMTLYGKTVPGTHAAEETTDSQE